MRNSNSGFSFVSMLSPWARAFNMLNDNFRVVELHVSWYSKDFSRMRDLSHLQFLEFREKLLLHELQFPGARSLPLGRTLDIPHSSGQRVFPPLFCNRPLVLILHGRRGLD